jgi:(p)ppGpp synthase/HD superfamily hydrolase
MRSQDDDREIERAVGAMVDALRRKNNKSKPVILHSLRVGLYLYGLDFGKETVQAGVLHDTVEASGLPLSEIEAQFGPKVAGLVQANSNDESIEDKTERYKDTFRRCMEQGTDALSIKAADLLDNTVHSYKGEKDAEKRQKDLEKVRYFLDFALGRLRGSQVWADLHREYSSAAG